MASLRNAVKRRTHKERGQPEHRQGLGLLEKKKDYQVRAKHVQEQKKRIKEYQMKAAFRNPDEFYFGMVGRKLTEDGQHREIIPGLTEEESKLVESKNLAYLVNLRSTEITNIAKMRSNLHETDLMTQIKKPNKHILFGETQQEIDQLLARESPVGVLELPKNEEMEAKNAKKYKELSERQERLKKIEKIIAHAKTQKLLEVSSKGQDRVKVQDATESHPAIYKWKQIRRR